MNNSAKSYLFRKNISLSFFKFLERKKIDYSYLGNTFNFPQKIKTDVDMYVDFKNIDDLKMILSKFTKRKNLEVINFIQHEFSHINVIVCNINKKDDEYLSLDICNEFVHLSRKLINFKQVQKKIFNKKEFNFKILDSKHEFLYYFLKKIIKKDIEKSSFLYLKKKFRSLKNYESQIFFSLDDFILLQKIFKTNKIFHFKFYNHYFKNKLIDKKRKNFLKEIFRYFIRNKYKTGFHIVFLGCDGSGKSSQINSLINSKLNINVFRNYSVYHLYNKQFSKKNSPQLPYQKTSYNLTLSFVKILFLYFKFLFNYFFELYPRIRSSHLIISDRYYQDVIIDPKRYRIGHLKSFLNLIFKLLPKPDLIIILDSTVGSLIKRQNEINEKQIKDLVLKFKNYQKKCNYCIIVKSNNTIEKINRKIIKLIKYQKLLLYKKSLDKG